MRTIALVVSLCTLSQAAIAETRECRFIPDPTGRLACYDKASPVEKSPARTSGSKLSTAGPVYGDTVAAEDARMNARLNSICRGC
jgi:hypothetical protein